MTGIRSGPRRSTPTGARVVVARPPRSSWPPPRNRTSGALRTSGRSRSSSGPSDTRPFGLSTPWRRGRRAARAAGPFGPDARRRRAQGARLGAGPAGSEVGLSQAAGRCGHGVGADVGGGKTQEDQGPHQSHQPVTECESETRYAEVASETFRIRITRAKEVGWVGEVGDGVPRTGQPARDCATGGLARELRAARKSDQRHGVISAWAQAAGGRAGFRDETLVAELPRPFLNHAVANLARRYGWDVRGLAPVIRARRRPPPPPAARPRRGAGPCLLRLAGRAAAVAHRVARRRRDPARTPAERRLERSRARRRLAPPLGQRGIAPRRSRPALPQQLGRAPVRPRDHRPPAAGRGACRPPRRGSGHLLRRTSRAR